ncbi:MAG: hypothetical protein K0B10_14725 [Vicingaceae bacterium]|nr:hypothetical protein [Vicingaceae bacterium]
MASILITVSCTKKEVSGLPNPNSVAIVSDNNQRSFIGEGDNMLPDFDSGEGQPACKSGPGYCFEIIIVGEFGQSFIDAIDGDFAGLQDFLTQSNIKELSDGDLVIKQALLDVRDGSYEVSYEILPNDTERVVFLFADENPNVENHDIALVLNR